MGFVSSIVVGRTSEWSCMGYGETIWEQCWWVNNVMWVSFAVMLGIWFGPLYLLNRKYPDTVIGSLVGLAWLFGGGVVAFGITVVVIHPILLAIVGA
jgi:hypothetical protein